MMNLMIVEDEPPILREIKSTILSFPEEYNIENTFYNGQDAITYLNEHHLNIDVLITDIHVPVVGGLELIEYVADNFPHILCIILSGYHEFEYAKKALQLNVFEYLLKPVNELELQKILKKAYTKKCIETITPQRHVIPTTNHDITFKKTYYYLSYICLGSYPNDSNLYSETMDQHWKRLEQNYLTMKFKDSDINYWLIHGPSSSEKVLLLSFTLDYAKQLTTLLEELLTELSTGEMTVTIVALHDTVSIHNLSKNTQLLRKFTKQHICFGKSQLLHYNVNYDTTCDLSHFYSKLKKLSLLFEHDAISLFKNELFSLLQLMKQECLVQKSMQLILNSLLTQCISICMQNANTNQFNAHTTIDDLIYLSSSYEALYSNLKLIFDDLFQMNMNKHTCNDKHSTLLRIDGYIKEHYREPINTKIIAEEFGFTPAYLSKIFRDYKEITPSDYITALRLEKAKELLSHSMDLSVKEVAAYVGYDDSLYFSKVFKKHVNESPKNYQLTHMS